MSNQRFVALMGVMAFAIFSMYLAQPLTPNFLEGVRGLSLSETGIIFTAGALGNSLMAMTFSRIEPRRGFLFSQFLVMLFAFLIWKGTSLPVFALGYFLLGGFRAGRPDGSYLRHHGDHQRCDLYSYPSTGRHSF
jgi:hypothetical protein